MVAPSLWSLYLLSLFSSTHPDIGRERRKERERRTRNFPEQFIDLLGRVGCLGWMETGVAGNFPLESTRLSLHVIWDWMDHDGMNMKARILEYYGDGQRQASGEDGHDLVLATRLIMHVMKQE